MAVTFFEKWLEEKKKYDPKTGGQVFSGDDSEKTKKVRADISKADAEKAEKKKQRQQANRIKNSPVGKGGEEYGKDNPVPNTEVVDKKKPPEKKPDTSAQARKDAETDASVAAKYGREKKDLSQAELNKARAKDTEAKTAARIANTEAAKKAQQQKTQDRRDANIKGRKDSATRILKSKEKITSKDGSVTAGGKLASNLVKTARAVSKSSGLTAAGDRLKKKAVGKAVGYAAQKIKDLKKSKTQQQSKPQQQKALPPAAERKALPGSGSVKSLAGTRGMPGGPNKPEQKSIPPSRSGGSLPAGKPGGSVTAPTKRAPGTAKSGSGPSLGQQARNNPALKRKMIQQRMGSQRAAGQLSAMKQRGSQVSQRVQQQKPKPQGPARKFAQGFRDGVRDTVKFAGKVKKTLSNQYDWRDELVSEDLAAAAKKVGQFVGTIESIKRKESKKKKPKKQRTKKSKKWQPSLTAFGNTVSHTLKKISSNWREEFLHEVEQPEMGETDQKEPDSKSKSKKGDTEEKKIDVMKGKNKVEVNPQLKAESFVTERAKSGELNKRPKGAIARARAAQGLSADDRVTDTKYRKLGKVTKKVSRSSKDWRTTDVVEEAPPGREKQVKALKKKFPNDPEAPYKIAWAQHNKESVMIQDANGNDFLEVIDVIKAEPLVPVKEGKFNGNGKQEKFNRAMNAYRKAQRAGNLSNKERVDRLKDNAKIRREAEKKEKKGKQFAGGQVYNEDKKSKLVSIVKAAANEKKRKNALQIQKYVGEETPDAISGKDLKRISFLSGKRTRFGPEETAKRKAALAKKHGGEENIKGHPQFKS